jgi:hypothetical protein
MDLIDMSRITKRTLGTIAASLAVLIPAAVLSIPRPVAASGAGAGVRHVFVIVLENEGSASTFGDPAADPYLAGTLPSLGAFVPNYFGIGHESNDNYVAMISGQGPGPQSQADCQLYDDFQGSVLSGTGTPLDGQAAGSGCIYPTSVPTITDQLAAAGLTWKGYMGDMGNVPTREAAGCGHPALGSQDGTQSAVAGDGYVSRHDPFVYFHGIMDDQASCAAHIVPLGTSSGSLPATAPVGTTGLVTDLGRIATTPNLSFIVPNVCDDGHDYPCTNEPTPSTSAVGDIDTFLRTWVPLITNSPAFHKDGLLAIVFDEASGPPNGDSSACCDEVPGPNSPLPGIDGPGGGRTGAVLLSPFIKGGTVSQTAYNHYALLGSLEDIFGVARLGFAADVPNSFGVDVFTGR